MPATSELPGARLRALLDAGTVTLPGAFNGLVARAAADAGFDGLYVSGAAVSAAQGLPDVGLVTFEGFARVIGEVATASGLPVLADADTGFGEEEIIRRALAAYHHAGAAGFHIEDQAFPKRCGHLDGKALIAVDHMVEKVRAAAEARDELTDGTFIVCARTDARGVDGLDAAISRAAAYVDAGADMIFPEGLTSEAEFAAVAEALARRPGRTPYLLANMTEFGKTPPIPVARFAELGYRAVIFPVTLLRSAMGAVREALDVLKTDGSADRLLARMLTRAQLYDLIDYRPGTAWKYPAPRRRPRTPASGA